MKKTINVVKALLVLCDKAKNIGVGFYVLLTFNNTFVFFSCLFFIVTWMINGTLSNKAKNIGVTFSVMMMIKHNFLLFSFLFFIYVDDQ